MAPPSSGLKSPSTDKTKDASLEDHNLNTYHRENLKAKVKGKAILVTGREGPTFSRQLPHRWR
jgi:hypothetical protein